MTARYIAANTTLAFFGGGSKFKLYLLGGEYGIRWVE